MARDPRVPLSAAYPGLRNARRTAPSPTAETGCDRPRVAPRPVGSVPRALGARGSGMSWSKAREGTRADPLTPPQERAGDRPPPPPLSSRPSLPQRGAEITPSPRGSDLGTWAGFRARPPALGFSTAFPPGSQFCTPNKVPRPQARAGKAVAAVLSGAGREDATCLCPRRGGRRGPFGSPPGHSLAETSPFGLPGSAHAPTPRLSSLPLSRGHLGPEPRVPPGH